MNNRPKKLVQVQDLYNKNNEKVGVVKIEVPNAIWNDKLNCWIALSSDIKSKLKEC